MTDPKIEEGFADYAEQVVDAVGQLTGGKDGTKFNVTIERDEMRVTVSGYFQGRAGVAAMHVEPVCTCGEDETK